MVGVGIDVAKNKSTVAIIGSNNELILGPTEFYHREDQLDKLIAIINGIQNKHFIMMENNEYSGAF